MENAHVPRTKPARKQQQRSLVTQQKLLDAAIEALPAEARRVAAPVVRTRSPQPSALVIGGGVVGLWMGFMACHHSLSWTRR